LHAAGARGVRFAFNPQHGGTLDKTVFSHVLECIEGLGWFVNLHFDGASLPGLEDWIASIPATVVIDHMGRIDPGLGLDQLPFQALTRLAARNNIWVKLTGADRISRVGWPYSDVVPFARRLADLAGDRLLWGSDWPHTGYFDAARMPDPGKLLRALADFIPDRTLRDQVLTTNPLKLLRVAL
jgi:predicted TIM-barrel fold metal-dependent hydrolase